MMGRLSAKESLVALGHAYDRGIRHFDTARSYGWGEAEGLLGSFLSSYPRDSYVLVTKCGLLPVRRGSWLRRAKAAARAMIGLYPPAGRLVRKIASSRMYQPVASYDIAFLEQSLTTSLGDLKTSYVDVLLLHSFAPESDGFGDVLYWMKTLQQKGAIRRYGVSIEKDIYSGLEFLDHWGVLHECVVQAPVSHQLLTLPEKWRHASFIAHSPFRFLATEKTDGSGNKNRTLTDLFAALGQACRCEKLICSMFSVTHIDENILAHRAAVHGDSASGREYTNPAAYESL